MERTQRFRLDRQQPISAEAYEYRAGSRVKEHKHAAAQLVYATVGAMRILTRDGVYVVPPQRGVWIPPEIPHTIDILSNVSMRTVYVRVNEAAALPKQCRVVAVSGLLRHLILAAIEMPDDYRLDGHNRALVKLLIDEIQTVHQEPLKLLNPIDRRLAHVARDIKANPADGRPLATWAKTANASERTLARLFLQDTGLTFAQWRQQLRLIKAIEMLANETPVTVVAMQLGYSSASAFGFMFRRALGCSPSAYFA